MSYLIRQIYSARRRPASRCRDIIRLAAFAIGVFLGTNAETAAEYVEETSTFLVIRDFLSFQIPRSSVVYFDTKTPSGKDEPDAEIRDETRRLLAEQLSLVGEAAPAQYKLGIRLYEYTNYSIRAAGGRPAVGFIMFALCVLPFKETSESCQQLTFFYFDKEPRLTMFRRAASEWLALVVVQ